MTPGQMILASARVAELKLIAADLTVANRDPPRIVLTRDPPRDRRRLLALLAHERARNAKLRELLHHE